MSFISKISLFITSAIALTLCTGCINEDFAGRSDADIPAVEKIVNSPANSVQGQLLICMSDTESEKEAVLSELADQMEVKSFKKVFHVNAHNEKYLRKYGLDRWYLLEFEGCGTEAAADRLAEMSIVSKVQYNTLTSLDVEEPKPITEEADVREDLPFEEAFLKDQWNLINVGDKVIAATAEAGADIGVKDVWSKLTGGDSEIIVAVLDGPVKYDHEALKENMWVNALEVAGDKIDNDGNGYVDDIHGWNFELDTCKINWDAKGQSSHGTHVAGIVAAVNNNGKGVSGVAGGTGNNDGAKIMSCQILSGGRSGNANASVHAFIYAADNGACIAQCSYGTHNIITNDFDYINGSDATDGSPLENAALRYFLDPANSNHESLEGNIAVFAAGNHSNPYSGYPGALPYVLSVTAFRNDYLPGGYTNYGPGCKIAAPGGEYGNVKGDYSGMILSTGVSGAASPSPGVETAKGENRNYVYMQGTSMACPHVSGVIALGISYAKKLGKKFTREEMTSLLLTSVNDIDRFNEGGSRSFLKSNVDGTSETVMIDMNRYKGQMGTGAVDAWKFLMAIEGTPSVMAAVGEKAKIDLSQYCNPSLKYEISVDETSATSLGLSSDPVIKDGCLEIECSKIGAGKILISSAVGKDPELEDGIGEMAYSREISIVSRPYVAKNGGWL